MIMSRTISSSHNHIMELLDVAGRRLLFVMATDHEYGEELQRRFRPLITGVGPVESAAVLAGALARLEVDGRLPDLVVSAGSAGSATLARGGVFCVSQVSWRDVDASALGIPAGVTPFLGIDPVQILPWQVPGLASASLSTGSDIVTGSRYDQIEADMVDMETWAVLRVCQRAGVALVGLRGISDGRDDLEEMSDWTDMLTVIDRELATAVDRLTGAVGDGLVEAHRWK